MLIVKTSTLRLFLDHLNRIVRDDSLFAKPPCDESLAAIDVSPATTWDDVNDATDLAETLWGIFDGETADAYWDATLVVAPEDWTPTLLALRDRIPTGDIDLAMRLSIDCAARSWMTSSIGMHPLDPAGFFLKLVTPGG